MIKVACLSYESFFVVVTQGGVSKFNSVLCSVHQLPSDKLFAFTLDSEKKIILTISNTKSAQKMP